ncbi:Phospholipase D beta 1 [Glycine soja]|uniref:phospholipase D n=1 Tax=Glycine soja TaxID=3848 RepID=A0A0B2RBK6_GLYSO|nr:Phospholipase D beta 1 [Glycine soja]
MKSYRPSANARTEVRRNNYKVVVDADEGRRRGEDTMVEIRKNRREESLQKKRCEGLQFQQIPSSLLSTVIEKKVGLMNTHDEDTRQFFKNSSEAGTIYTHHQKTVIVDADAGQNKRKIKAFIGGLDLCVGRYDTPNHSIFRTLQTTHKDDYHNPNFEGPVTGCPRQPWHDLHSQVDGPAAYDILTNFEERWLRALKMHRYQKMRSSHDDSLLKIDRIPDIVGIDEVPCQNENNRETWHVQVFRSIDYNSVKGFPKEPQDAIRRNLVCGKNVLIDMSIHSAMTLLLGPPCSGKTTLLLVLGAKLDPKLKFSGKVTYNGRGMDEFVPQKTAAYANQNDLHVAELTALANEGQKANLMTDYVLRILGLEVCADTIVRNAMLRGISGGQRKRVTTGEMLVGPTNALFMDEISIGVRKTLNSELWHAFAGLLVSLPQVGSVLLPSRT